MRRQDRGALCWIPLCVLSDLLLRAAVSLIRTSNIEWFQKIWRRGGDSNPRYLSVHTISSRAPSAARSPLREQAKYTIDHFSVKGFLGGKSPESISVWTDKNSQEKILKRTTMCGLTPDLTAFATRIAG
jgi:hypothetical protein